METKVFEVDPLNPDEETLKMASKVIKNGGLVAFPTETVYGLGADTFKEKAVMKIFEVKKRPPDNPLIVHISRLDQLENVITEFPEIAEKLAKIFWPGPLTMILKRSGKVPDIVCAGLPTVAVRMPSHPVAKRLIELSGTPIAAPSANLSGRPSPTSGEHVVRDLSGKVDVILKAGKTPFGLESTIVDISKYPPILLRPGPVTVERLREILPDLQVPDHVYGELFEGRPLSPGMKYRHYSPIKPLILVENPRRMDEILERYEKAVVVCPAEHVERYSSRRTITLGSLENPYSIAHNLFDVLRKVDEEEGTPIVVEGFEEKGILFSVMNRLRKAASKIVR